jgi:hypothetical protein
MGFVKTHLGKHQGNTQRQKLLYGPQRNVDDGIVVIMKDWLEKERLGYW